MSHCKLVIGVNKVDSISDEEFHHYWSVEHPKIWLSIPIVKEKIMTYSQFHVNSKDSIALKALGLPIGNFDGQVTMITKNFEDLMAVFQDEKYQRIVVPDELKFLKREQAVMMIGHEEVKQDSYTPLPGVLGDFSSDSKIKTQHVEGSGEKPLAS